MVIRPFEADLAGREWGAGMDFEHWEVEKILKATDTTHVQAQGKVSGLLRFRLVDGKPLLDELKIDGDGPGKIIYETAGFAFAKKKIQYLDEFQGLLAAGQEALVRKALEDFDYSVLKLDAKRDGGKDPTVDIFIRGKNQNLANGQVFELRVPIRGNIDSLFGDSLLRQIQENEE